MASLAFDDEENDLDEEERQALEEALARRKRAAQPMSIADKVSAQREAALAQDRPVFVSRAQREAVKAEIESEQAEIEALMDEAEREQRDAYMQRVRDEVRHSRSGAGSGRGRRPRHR